MADRPKVIKQFTLAFPHPFHAAKAFQVSLSAIGDQTMGRQRIAAVTGDFSAVIGTHLDDGHGGVFPYFQQGEGYANMVVEVAFGRISAVRRDSTANQFLGSGFAIAAGDGEEGMLNCFR